MINYKTIKLEVDKDVPSLITCNKCGKQDYIGEGALDFAEMQKYQTIELSFGYGSKFDTDQWSFELCENCLVEFARSFKQLPEGYDENYTNDVYPINQ